MTKKLSAILISVVLIVSCMMVPAMASDGESPYTFTLADADRTPAGAVSKDGTVTWTVTVPEGQAGNYSITWNGKTNQTVTTRYLTFTVSSGDQTVMGTAQCASATSTVVEAELKGLLSLEEGVNTITFTNISTVYNSAIKAATTNLVFTYAGEYDLLTAHTVYQNFNQSICEGVGKDIKAVGDQVGTNAWKLWNINVPADGKYGVYMYGGAQSKTENLASEGELYIYGNKACSFSIPWTGNTTGAAGWVNRNLNYLGDIVLQEGDNKVRYLCTGGAGTRDNIDNKIYFVRKDSSEFSYVPSVTYSNIDVYVKDGVWTAKLVNSRVKYAALDAYLVFYDEDDNVIDYQKTTQIFYDNTVLVSFPEIPEDIKYDSVKLLLWEYDSILPMCKAHFEDGSVSE